MQETNKQMKMQRCRDWIVKEKETKTQGTHTHTKTERQRVWNKYGKEPHFIVKYTEYFF